MNAKIRSPGYIIEFARKMRLNRYILDFYCYEKKIAIEIDGDIHKFRQEYDEYRDNFLKSIGISTLRFTNEDVIHNINYVLAEIKKDFNFITTFLQVPGFPSPRRIYLMLDYNTLPPPPEGV